MNEPSAQDMDAALDIMEAQQREQLALSLLLERFRSQANHHLALQVRMGDMPSFLTSVTLRWVAEKVGFAADLPIFRESCEGSTRISVDTGTQDAVQQRQPDWRRQREMAAYLAMRTHHKFPPLLVVGYQRWVCQERHERWGVDGRAMNDSLKLRPLEGSGAYWDIDDSETEFYALDGQHRLMAIIGLRELIQTGTLPAYDQRRIPRKTGALFRDEVIDRIHKSNGESRADIHERLQYLMEERIGVEILPAVCIEETYDGALRRLRQIFVDVNGGCDGNHAF